MLSIRRSYEGRRLYLHGNDALQPKLRLLSRRLPLHNLNVFIWLKKLIFKRKNQRFLLILKFITQNCAQYVKVVVMVSCFLCERKWKDSRENLLVLLIGKVSLMHFKIYFPVMLLQHKQTLVSAKFKFELKR